MSTKTTLQKILIATALIVSAATAFAQGTVSPVARQTWLDNNGAPAANYRLCTFQAGTSTLANTYTTAALSVANANPLVLDSAGRGTVFLTPGSTYKFILKDSTTTTCVPDTGVTIWSVDNVSAVPASNVSVDIDGTAGESLAAGDVVYLSDGSGSKNAGQWYLADADLTYASLTPQIGLTTAAIASGASGSIRIQGRTTGLSGLTTGGSYYISATAGDLTSTAPLNARYVGQADSTTALITTPNPPLAASTVVPSVSPLLKSLSQGRLSLTTGVPVTTSDVTAATTLYWVPYGGNQIALYTGSVWVVFNQAQLSIAVPATTATVYDVFMDYASGTPALLLAAWNSATARHAAGIYATLLPTQDGVYVQSTDGTAINATRRYLGSFRTTGVSGQTEDSLTKRFVWNYYNRVARELKRIETTDAWTYTTATWQQANAAAANKFEIVIGVAEDAISITLFAASSNTNALVNRSVGIGEDSVTAPLSSSLITRAGGAANDIVDMTLPFIKTPAVGYHYYAWLEISTATGTTTWYGDNGSTTIQTGLVGMWKS